MATKFHIQDIVRFPRRYDHLNREMPIVTGEIVSFANLRDAEGPYQSCNIDVGGRVVRGINSRNLKRVEA
jgi:hypothetical protein